MVLLAIALAGLSGCTQAHQPSALVASTPRLRATPTPAPVLTNEPAATYGSVFTDKLAVSVVLEGYTDDETMRAVTDEIRRAGVPCVFFISGVDASEHPQVVKRIAEAGIEVGNYGLNALENMQRNDIDANIHQFQRGQELLTHATGRRPVLFRCNRSDYTPDLMKAAAYTGLEAGVLPNIFVNHSSFDEAEDAIPFVRKLTRGSIISIKLGQALKGDEYQGTEEIMDPMAIDPEPFLSDNMDETIHAAYANITNVVSWLLEALEKENYAILSPEALQGERVAAFDHPAQLSDETLKELDAASYSLPVTDAPLGVPASAATGDRMPEGTVFVGDSVLAGVGGYVKWRQETHPEYLGGARFLTANNLGIVAAQSGVASVSTHPSVDGRLSSIAEAVEKMQAKVVYLIPGMSDARAGASAKLIDQLKLTIYQIRTRLPGVEIRMGSTPPGVAGRYGDPTNAAIFGCNLAVAKFCAQFDIPFVDAAFALRDAQGNLQESLCMDADTYGTHLSDQGCEAWIGYLLGHVPG